MAEDFDAFLLDNSAVRNVLVEVGHDSTTEYLSYRPYFDSVANRVYSPVVIGSSVRITRKLGYQNLDGGLTFGDIELENTDGSLDSWLDFIWSNRAIEIAVGAVTWARADYVTKFIGVVEGIDSKSRNVLNIKVRDIMQRLNFPVTELKLGGSTDNKDELQPLLFGECHNITPLLTNPATLEYQFHQGNSEDAKEVRSNGIPASVSKNLSNGKFTPTVNPQGTTITLSAQGDKPSGVWNTTVATIIQRLATAFGNADNRLSVSDIDTSNFNSFDSANNQDIGVYFKTRQNLLVAVKDIAASVGAQLLPSELGKLQLHKVDLVSVGSISETITANDVIDKSLKIVEMTEVEAAITLGYAKNWTVQNNLDSGLVQESKDSFAKEWLTVTKENSTVKASHKLDGEPRRIDTFLLSESEADTEAQRQVDNFSTQRKIISFTGRARLLNLEIGSWVTIQYPRFGMDAGVPGVVLRMTPDWIKSRVQIDIVIR
ncbi:hypothetical protein [uncultured Paraglaciecola sp.]|uniref:hypothetical protein n=1 Tax=uncultured Paraglaciecola sp. TaxID=1765024 RepID=UPI002611EA7E|nr:hypothetical protein [uncultured Paraglaciecola sp.]